MNSILKRVLGVAVAAAMAVAGVGALTGTANADEVTTPVTFTFTAESSEQLTGRTIEVYRIGKFTSYINGSNTYYGVESANDDDEDTLTDAVKYAFTTTGDSGDSKVDVPEDEDPMTWAAAQGLFDTLSTVRPWNQSDTREFANYLKDHKEDLTQYTDGSPTLTVPTGSDNSWTSTLTLPAGVYLIVDATDGTDSVTQAVPMIVYSGTLDTDGKTITNPGVAGTGSTVAFKNTKSDLPAKTADKTSVSVGDTIQYTLEYTIPEPAPAAFQFNDKPSLGLTVDYDSIAVTATKEGETPQTKPLTVGDSTNEDCYVVKMNNGTADGNGKLYFSIVLRNPGELAGWTVTVTYNATVNRSAVSNAGQTNSVWNKLVSNDGSQDYTPNNTPTSELFSFTFTKTKADGTTPLSGATFSIDGDTLPEDYPADLKTATSGDNGGVTFSGLAAGTYTVIETSVPTGFLQNVKPSFTVTINNDGTVKYKETTAWGLVTDDGGNTATVKNVENITQLPLTGAAGTMLFTVLGLLIAGAGVTVYMKSRSMRHMMRA